MHAWEQIQLTIDYIESHIGEEMTIAELSGMAALSPFYYQRLFSRLVKRPVGEYIRLRRMALATEALVKTDKRILDVALELGFSSHEHFTRTFKDTFGITPEEYRSHPRALNRMTRPELLLNYVLIDEGVPLITEGIVLEVNRRKLDMPVNFAGLCGDFPLSLMEELGTKSGEDPLDDLWNELHARKASELKLGDEAEELGVTKMSDKPGMFAYFAGAASDDVPEGFDKWELPAGEYAVCAFESEDFRALVMDALYKATNYMYNVWLPNHKLQTGPFCAERYKSHSMETTKMELWLRIEDN